MTIGSDQRLDKWLWHARMFKTRSRATAFAITGKIRVNGDRARKPSLAVGPGDVLTFALANRVRILKIAGIAASRRPFSEAVALYEDLSPPDPQIELKRRSRDLALPEGRERGQGRPTKRERRALDRWNRLAD